MVNSISIKFNTKIPNSNAIYIIKVKLILKRNNIYEKIIYRFYLPLHIVALEEKHVRDLWNNLITIITYLIKIIFLYFYYISILFKRILTWNIVFLLVCFYIPIRRSLQSVHP